MTINNPPQADNTIFTMTQTKNIVMAVLAGAGVLALMLWTARPAGNPGGASRAVAEEPPVARPAAEDALRASEAFFNFGTISMAAGPVAHRFIVQNTSSEPVTVRKLYTSCMCTTASISVSDRRAGPFGMPGHGFSPEANLAIAPGEAAEVEIVFDPAAHGPSGVGQINRVVYLETGSGAPFTLRIAATVKP